ncbi:CRISPR-associated ring nuclease Csm6 [Psychrobacter sp. I-STPA6b]|uniref:CRISPR-associated ring nuclease Csm6 n=1 Tax=Psychrobacter sp. I-STPA6b TaxID=2585718 RepID=UPI001D0CD147|nr:CRISPR-associated ring nuclease Csm6 [Psychrobacter sp. I-STPA6b]
MKNILLMVTGGSPQIITETLYGLAIMPNSDEAWIPDEIHIMSTAYGINQVKKRLLCEGNLQKMLDDFNLQFDIKNNLSLHTLEGEDGNLLEDLREPRENNLAANQILKLVHQYTEDKNTQVHMSIAGGLKTMTYYAGYAMSLYGRENDSMSHVRVGKDFENLQEFFYPAKNKDTLIYDRNGKALDAYGAQMWFIDVPFIRLRYILPQEIYKAHLVSQEFTEIIEVVNEALRPLKMKINTKDKTININDLSCKLPPLEFSIYSWLAYRHMELKEPSIPSPSVDITNYQDEFDKFNKKIQNRTYDISDITANYSKIKNKFISSFGINIAEKIHIRTENYQSFLGNIKPADISIIWVEDPEIIDNENSSYKVTLYLKDASITIKNEVYKLDATEFILYLWIIIRKLDNKAIIELSKNDNPLHDHLREIKELCEKLLKYQPSIDKSIYDVFKYMDDEKLKSIIAKINKDIENKFTTQIAEEIGIKTHTIDNNSLYIPLDKMRFEIDK